MKQETTPTPKTHKYTFKKSSNSCMDLADNIQKIAKQRKAIDLIGLKKSHKNMMSIQGKMMISKLQSSTCRALQRTKWTLKTDGWEDCLGVIDLDLNIEGKLDNVYDNNTGIVYKNMTECIYFENAFNNLKTKGEFGKLIIARTDHNTTFKDEIYVEIVKIAKGEVGRKLLQSIFDGNFEVTICGSLQEKECWVTLPKNDSLKKDGERTIDGSRNKGTDAKIIVPAKLNDAIGKYYDNNFATHNHYNFVCIAHELIHAYHMINGEIYSEEVLHKLDDPEYHNKEEEVTIATGTITENMILAENSYPLRFGHLGECPNGKVRLVGFRELNLKNISDLFNITLYDFLQQNYNIVESILFKKEIAELCITNNEDLKKYIINEIDGEMLYDYLLKSPLIIQYIMDKMCPFHKNNFSNKKVPFCLNNNIDIIRNNDMLSKIDKYAESTFNEIYKNDAYIYNWIIRNLKIIDEPIDKYLHTEIFCNNGYFCKVPKDETIKKIVSKYAPHVLADYLQFSKSMFTLEDVVKIKQMKTSILNTIAKIAETTAIKIVQNTFQIPNHKMHRITRVEGDFKREICSEFICNKYHMPVPVFEKYNKNVILLPGNYVIVRY